VTGCQCCQSIDASDAVNLRHQICYIEGTTHVVRIACPLGVTNTVCGGHERSLQCDVCILHRST
jgi:hypothetical protein